MNLEKIKRVNLNLEDRIKIVNEKKDELTVKFNDVDSKYTALLQVDEYLKEDNQKLRTENNEKKQMELIKEYD